MQASGEIERRLVTICSDPLLTSSASPSGFPPRLSQRFGPGKPECDFCQQRIAAAGGNGRWCQATVNSRRKRDRRSSARPRISHAVGRLHANQSAEYSTITREQMTKRFHRAFDYFEATGLRRLEKKTAIAIGTVSNERNPGKAVLWHVRECKSALALSARIPAICQIQNRRQCGV